jgi:hypothetical protein
LVELQPSKLIVEGSSPFSRSVTYILYMHPEPLDYRCPLCDSPVIWFHNNNRPGSTSEIKCANNITSSRIDWDPKTAYICDWKGVAVRQKNGSIALYYAGEQRRLKLFPSHALSMMRYVKK